MAAVRYVNMYSFRNTIDMYVSKIRKGEREAQMHNGFVCLVIQKVL